MGPQNACKSVWWHMLTIPVLQEIDEQIPEARQSA